MREIKFRGKRIDNDEWVYGWFSEDYGYAEILTEYNDCEVILETVGQYTGLKDQNGVEIYEGMSYGSLPVNMTKVCGSILMYRLSKI